MAVAGTVEKGMERSNNHTLVDARRSSTDVAATAVGFIFIMLEQAGTSISKVGIIKAKCRQVLYQRAAD